MRRSRTPVSEQYRMVMEARQSGLSDAEWCRQNGIGTSTFYNWTVRLRKRGCELPNPWNDVQLPSPKQDVVLLDVIPDEPEAHPMCIDAPSQESSLILEMNGAKQPRRYYKNESSEVWSMEHSYGEGFVAEDKMIIRFSKPNVNAWLIVKDKSRKNIEEYISYAYALFDDIVPESGESNVEVIVDANVQEYWPEELIEKYSTDDNTKD